MTLKPLSALITCITAILGLSTLYAPPSPVSGPFTATTESPWEPDPVETTMPQRTSTQTYVPTTVANCADAIALARQVGWPENELDTLGVVMLRESNCTTSAHNVTDPNGGSYGLTQINGFWCLPNTNWPIGWLQAQGTIDDCSDLFIPENNLKSALAVWRNSGWGPWSTKP